MVINSLQDWLINKLNGYFIIHYAKDFGWLGLSVI